MIQVGKRGVFAMGQAVPIRTDYTASEVRRFAKCAKDGAQARRLLALAAVLDGVSREEAAKLGGMDRQTLRDWVIRFNEQGPDGLINIPSRGAPPKLDDTHKAFLRRIVEGGPIPAIHGVVRWRACDLIIRLHGEFVLSVSDDTIYRALKDLGFSHVSARPKTYKQDADAMAAFKKTLPYAWRKSARHAPGRGAGAALVLPSCNTEAMQLHLDEIATKVPPGAHAVLILDQAGWHGAKDLKAPINISLLPLPPRAPELNPQENIWQFMRANWLSNRIFKSFDAN